MQGNGLWSGIELPEMAGGDIANMMAFMVLQGHKTAESPLRPRDLPIFFKFTSDSLQIQFRFTSDSFQI